MENGPLQISVFMVIFANMNKNFDIVIVGAGLVGSSVAIALQSLHRRIAILETHLPASVFNAAVNDTRPLALSYGSQIILQTLNVWPALQSLTTDIQTVHVSEQNRFGSLYFRASEEKVPALGYVVPAGDLHRSLYQEAARQPGVEFISIQKINQIQYQPSSMTVHYETIQGKMTLQTPLLICADGTESTTRRLLNIAVKENSVKEKAITALLEVSEGHQQIAYERFTKQGILALLPLKNSRQSRLVWTMNLDLAEESMQWSDLQLSRAIEKNFNDRLGEVKIIERGKQYPLQLLFAEEQIRSGMVLIGNAAHTLYPLAAQGFNLGLRDAATLAEILTDGQSQGQALGDIKVLEKYLQWRLDDQRWISDLTSDVNQLFALQFPFLGTIRGLGLLATDLLPSFKHRLAKRLMGLSGRLPKLAMGIPL